MKNLSFALLFLCSIPAFAEGKLSDESQAGVVITNGNSHTQNYNVASITRYAWEKNTLELKGNYLRAVTSGELNSLNWLVSLRYERSLKDFLKGFVSETLEGDQFAGVMQRYNTDLGAKYFFYNTEKIVTWFGEAGYRYTNEHNTNGLTKGYQKARVYTEAENFFNPTTSARLWLEYIPNFTLPEMWLLNAELSLSSALNSTFAVKSAYGLRYNHSPVILSAQKTDSTFSTSLVAKF